MKKQILFCSLFLLTALQIWAQSPLPAFAHEADQHQAKAGHFATPIHSIDTLLLPFYEDWESGTFTQHSWQTECVNWTINTVLGFPGKCAEFTWDPVLTNYFCGLISASIDAEQIIDGNIFLSFDLKIDDRIDTVSSEKLHIRLFADQNWILIDSVVAMGDVDWDNVEYDITEWAKGKVFHIGFFAQGENSAKFDSWFIDNIKIERICEKPMNLTSTKIYGTSQYFLIELNWLSPGATQGYWMSYNDGTFENAIASTEGGAGLAQMFNPTDYPVTITEVRYFNSSFDQYMQECEVWILAGDGETVLAGPYYVEDGPADDWVTVDVDGVTIEDGTFMVATFNVMGGGPYIGIDDSFYDGTLYFGNIGDFTELGGIGYFCIGSHEVFVEIDRNDLTRSYEMRNNHNVVSRELTGYNIWCNDEIIESNWPYTTYYDTIDEAIYLNCYYVSAVYDQCESDTLGYVCENGNLPPPGIDEYKDQIGIRFIPNPSIKEILIQAEHFIMINKIEVFNLEGKLELGFVLKENNYRLDVSSLKAGVYFVRLQTNHGPITKKLIKY